MTKEEWQKIYDEIYDLEEEFHQKWRQTGFRFKTEKKANDKRVSEIINKAVRIIQHNKELNDFIFDGKDDDYISYMEQTGFWVESVFRSYVADIRRMIEKQIQ